ncbi:MAG: hypothetical protein ACYDCL_00090 [Myxococcales bacterium]
MPSGGRSGAITLLSAALFAAGLAHAGKPTLAHALSRYRAFDAGGAERELRSLLSSSPRRHVAAMAHIYLGMIAMEFHYDSALAEEEFRKAVALEPTVDLPYAAAPKERMVFLRAQAEEVESVQAPRPPPAPAADIGLLPLEPEPPPRTQPAPAPAAPEAVAQAPRPASHAASYALFGAGAAALAAGAVFGVLDGQAESAGQTPVRSGYTAAELSALQRQAATDAIVADVGYAAGGLTCAVGLVLLFVPSSSHVPSVTAAPVPGGAVASLGGRF